MASKLSSCFLAQGWAGLNVKHSDVRFFPLPCQRLLPASCKMRQRNLSSQPRRQTKKVSQERLPTNANFQQSADEEHEPETSETDIILSLNPETSETDAILSLNPEASETDEILSLNPETSETDEISSLNPETSEADEILSLKPETDEILSLDPDSISDHDVDPTLVTEEKSKKEVNGLALVKEIKPALIDDDGGEQLSGVHIQDLISMIKNAERNIVLLNLARVRALEDLGTIVNEKQSLQGQINVLESRLAETDARLKVATDEKIDVNLLANQLEKLQSDLSTRDSGDGGEAFSPLYSNTLNSLIEELNVVKKENISLKESLEDMKKQFDEIKSTDERVLMLENERSHLESALKDLELKLPVDKEDVSELSGLKVDYQSLFEKVEDLQVLLDKSTKQADQAVSVVQQNQELRKKVDRLEESRDDVNVYKSKSEKLQQYNELMQQKMTFLDERLQKSDEDIHSYIQSHQESMQELQDTLNSLKEESMKRAVDEPVNDMPWEFWSRLLLMIDGWLLEKKISTIDANMLREMVWKRDGRICEAYVTCKEQNEGEAISTFLELTSTSKRAGLHVIHIAAEMAPVAKVGGLGDVVTGLGKALQRRGHLVEIVIPKYDCMQYEHIRDLRALDVVLESYFDGHLFKSKVWVGTVEGLPVYFIEPEHPSKFFWRGQFYGEHDDFKRFSFFSRAALELIHQAGKRPDIIHCHDWQTAFVAPLYWNIYTSKGLDSARVCFTCHNFEYQGSAPASELSSCGLDAHQLNRHDRMQDNNSHDRVNAVKGAIVFSNVVTTVSPTYAQEVRTAEGGKGLHTTINSHMKKFAGILNGIDYDSWNPATDKFLKVQYSVNDLQGKAENKEALRRQLGLSSSDVRRPLVGCITRLVPQKGVHLIRHAIYRTMELGGQFVLLGSSPVPDIQREFEGIANYFQSNENVRLILKYDESLSRLIYAASDMFIIPSIFEPCGLTQMIAMRYGSVPIVRKTGGLSDSVFDLDNDIMPNRIRNGFTFTRADEQGLDSALERALKLYASNREEWEELVKRIMGIDYSWDSSARQYEDLYVRSPDTPT